MEEDKEKKKVEIPNDGIRVKTSREFKLKDRPNRKHIMISFEDFGFLPEKIIIEKVHGRSNTFQVHAVLTEEAIKKEDKMKAEMEKAEKEQEAFLKKQALEVEKKKRNDNTKSAPAKGGAKGKGKAAAKPDSKVSKSD